MRQQRVSIIERRRTDQGDSTPVLSSHDSGPARMMLGTKDRFAVQWKLDRVHGGRILLGRICFWVANASSLTTGEGGR